MFSDAIWAWHDLPGDDNKQFPAIPGARQPGREL
jgi:hypothetical protein